VEAWEPLELCGRVPVQILKFDTSFVRFDFFEHHRTVHGGRIVQYFNLNSFSLYWEGLAESPAGGSGSETKAGTEPPLRTFSLTNR